jgi:hypothetical protein
LRVQRRVFLKRGIFGGALLATAGGLGLGFWPTSSTFRPKRALVALGERHFAILAAISARVVGAPGADPVEIAHAIDQTLSIAYEESLADLKNLLLLFDNALVAMVFDRRARPFTSLAPEEQDAVLDNWKTSSITLRRSGYRALRNLAVSAHYASPAVWESVGYPGPPEIAEDT